MSQLIKPAALARGPLSDPRSTGAPPKVRVSDILALQGTRRSGGRG